MNEANLKEYTDKINSSTIYKNDIILADKFQVNIFDPQVIPEDITGGVIAFIGSTGYGKTFLLRYILSKIHKEYDVFYLFSGTAKLQKDYNFFPKENIHEFYSEEKMTEIWNTAHKRVENGEKLLKQIIILDDVINDKEFIKGSVLKKYATGARHIGITVFLLSQLFSSLKNLKTNLRIVLSFESDSFKERRKFIDEYLSLINPRVGDLIYKKITSVPFQCVVVCCYKKDKNNKIYKFLAESVKDSSLHLKNKGTEISTVHSRPRRV